MAPWALSAYARRKPPRTRRRRRAWIVVVLGFCLALLPLAAAGAVEQWTAGSVAGAVGLTALTAILLACVTVAAAALIAARRERRPASEKHR